ncbi:MAG: hypothetical protein QNJ32_25390 [Xenococcaceae cyanobacterium MO_167.B27]|nr:hypothetical protein [Xenococcaceae cyanobacterium MO_167.B27]
MSPYKPIDIDKIKELIATATTAKQKQMYQRGEKNAGGLHPVDADTQQSIDRFKDPLHFNSFDQNLLVEAEQKLQEEQQELGEEQGNSVTKSVDLVGKRKESNEEDKSLVSNTLVIPKKEKINTPIQDKEVESEKKLSEKEDEELTDNSSDSAQEEEEKESEDDENEYNSVFTAVGVCQGKLILDESEKFNLELGGKNYDLFYANTKFWAYRGLKKQIAKTGKDDYPLMVYPKVTHFPNKNQPHNLYFQLVAFDAGNRADIQDSIFTELNDGEFKISGLWQFIPPSRLPCISVFRNYDPKLLEYIKQGEVAKKVQITKATHVPIIWKDSPVQPFRFNPKLKKEEQKPLYFVSIKAKFLPEKNLFLFIEQLAEPTQDVPRFLKTRKEDKMELNKQRNKTRKKSSFKKGIQNRKQSPKSGKKPAPIFKSKG